MTVAATDPLLQALRSGDRVAINVAAARLLDARGELGERWLTIARTLVHNGEVQLVTRAARLAIAQHDTPQTRFQAAQLLVAAGRHQEAAALVADLKTNDLGPGQRDHFLATHAMEMGDFSAARKLFERVVERLPYSGASWLSLSALPGEDDETLLTRMDGIAEGIARASAVDRAQWHYARAAAMNRLKRHQSAFESFARGAQIVGQTRKYNYADDSQIVDRLTKSFDRATVHNLASESQSEQPIFVTGLPRSGTTLIEQILERHSSVVGGGEMPFGAILAREVGGNDALQLQKFLAEGGTVAGLADLYLHLADQRFGKGRFVDKALGTSRILGILAVAFPQAPIIWLRRDPVDCAWSCFRTYFSRGVAWSWALEDIVGYFRLEDRLYEHWRGVLGNRVMTVPYEKFVIDPVTWTQRIFAHANLSFDANVMDSRPSDSAVATASVAQVRQEINRKGIGAAHPYRQWLGPFTSQYYTA